MAHLEKILVPVDFSEHSLVAARHAGALARRFHSEITLFHVNEFLVLHPMSGPLGFGITSSEAAREEHLARRREELNQFAKQELQGVPVRRVLCCGDPACLIVERARAEQSDLILMPTRGQGPLRRFLLGSVTAKVLHDSDRPVWTGAHFERSSGFDPDHVRHVMCAANFDPNSSKVVRWAAEFAAAVDAKLTVVHAAFESPPNLPDRYMFQWHDEARFGAQEHLRQLLLDLHVPADTMVVADGDVPRALAAAVRENAADVLVIGRNCPREPAGRLGTHAYPIICHAPCPVVSI